MIGTAEVTPNGGLERESYPKYRRWLQLGLTKETQMPSNTGGVSFCYVEMVRNGSALGHGGGPANKGKRP